MLLLYLLQAVQVLFVDLLGRFEALEFLLPLICSFIGGSQSRLQAQPISSEGSVLSLEYLHPYREVSYPVKGSMLRFNHLLVPVLLFLRILFQLRNFRFVLVFGLQKLNHGLF